MKTFIQRWRVPLAIIVLMHGIGHVLFLAPVFGLADWGQSTHSWLLTGNIGDALALVLGGLLWLASILGFAGVAVSLLTQTTWLRRGMIYSALASLAGLILFWANPANSSALFAALFDVIILACAWLIREHVADATGA